VEENSEIGLSASLSALEADFERSFSGSQELQSSTGSGAAPSATAASKPKRLVPSRFLQPAKREQEDLQRAVEESLAAEHAAQVAILTGSDQLRNGGLLQFEDDDDDEDEYLRSFEEENGDDEDDKADDD
jgi:hypothetical protein